MASIGDAAVDEQRPSLFELLSEQQLHGLLPPTLRYLLTVLTQRYPRYLLRVLNSFDELYALAMVMVEHHSLRTRGGTFTEHFYGLKRERALAGKHLEHLARAGAGTPQAVCALLQLNKAAVWRNVAVVVGVPYLKRKLDAAYERDAPRARLGTAFQRLPPNPTLRDRLRHAARWFLRHVYPSVHAASGFAVLAFYLGYLFDATGYASPLLWLVGTRVRRRTAADDQALGALLGATSSAVSASSAATLPSLAARALGGLSLVLPASIFALKFLEWWHASDFARQLSSRAGAHLDLPAPLAAGLPPQPPQPPLSSTATPSANASTAAGTMGRKGILKKESSFPLGATTRTEPLLAGGETSDDGQTATANAEAWAARAAPVAKPSLLPILTVPPPVDSALCPICGDPISTPTACQTGVVYCYICIHKWVAGQHERQETFLAQELSRVQRWESGAGRCAVTGRRVLGGTEGLRRLMV